MQLPTAKHRLTLLGEGKTQAANTVAYTRVPEKEQWPGAFAL